MQTPLEKSFFDIFGLDETFSVDQAGLRARFRDLQRKYHPDNFATASEAEKRMSAQFAAHINEAFVTLKDPVLRARYILSRHGVDLSHGSHMDTAFLMEQMELREELELACSANGGMSALMSLTDKVNRDYHAKLDELAALLDDRAGPELEEAEKLVRELQFYDRILQEIEEAEEGLL